VPAIVFVCTYTCTFVCKYIRACRDTAETEVAAAAVAEEEAATAQWFH